MIARVPPIVDEREPGRSDRQAGPPGPAAVHEPQRRHARLRPDRYLYIGMGDGGSGGDPGNRAQNRNSLLGKILRINIDTKRHYMIPPTNPYVGRAGHDLVWSYRAAQPVALLVRPGERRPLDRRRRPGEVRGDRPIAGPERRDAASTTAGASMEGNHCYNPSTGCDTSGKNMPIATYGHSQGCSVTGGYVYRGTAYPDLRGVYLFGDFCSGRIWGIDAAGAKPRRRRSSSTTRRSRSARSARTRPATSTSSTMPPARSGGSRDN